MKILASIFIIFFGLFAANLAFAQTWTQTSATITNLGWKSVAISADGSQIVAVAMTPAPPYNGPVCISTDSGETWVSNSISIEEATCIASSADGAKLALASQSEPVYVSTNAGESWVVSSPAFDCFRLASSADGTELVAAEVGGPIYRSTNSGINWSVISGTSGKSWGAIASSVDGTKLIAISSTSHSFAYSICTSTNSGNTWVSNTVPTLLTWVAVASSADGNILAAAPEGSALSPLGPGVIGSVPIYVSTNAGASWNSNSSPLLAWSAIACSASGKKMIAVGKKNNANSQSIFTSSDYGTTWISNNVPAENWSSVSISADGNLMAAATLFDGIWISQTAPSPQLNLTTSYTNLALSWLVPSTKFVLQQSPDLISWSSITDTPALNFTNLNNELTLSPSNTSGFFRLISQ